MGAASFVVVMCLKTHRGHMDTLRIIVQRLITIFVVVAVATFFLACLIRLLPGDPASIMVSNALPDQVNSIRIISGLDKNVFGYWWQWFSNMLTGDFGYYYQAAGNNPVSEILKRSIPTSILMVVYVQIVALFVSVPLGLVSAYKEGSRFDRALQSVLFVLSSVPSFALALVFSLFFALRWPILPPLGYAKPTEDLFMHIKYMILPVASLSVGIIASYTRLLRADVIATLKEDYVMMAMSKGISNNRVLWKHVLRPSSTTLLTSAALNMGALVGGTIVIETLFQIPGLGYEIAFAIVTRQVIALQTLIAIVAFAYVFFNSTVDIVANIIDPRTRERRA